MHHEVMQFVSELCVIYTHYSSDEMMHIFSTMLNTTQQSHPPEDQLDPRMLLNLVETAVQVHKKVGSMFLPIPERLHYAFNMNHISTLFK